MKSSTKDLQHSDTNEWQRSRTEKTPFLHRSSRKKNKCNRTTFLTYQFVNLKKKPVKKINYFLTIFSNSNLLYGIWMVIKPKFPLWQSPLFLRSSLFFWFVVTCGVRWVNSILIGWKLYVFFKKNISLKTKIFERDLF